MKKFTYLFIVFVAVILVFGVSAQAQNVTKWGKTSQGTAWPIKWDATSPAGSASIGTGAAKPTGWATIRGGFDATYEATTSNAVIVSGQMEFVGGGGASAYTWLRYALTYQDSSTLNYPGTDTAVWVSTLKHYGYEFCPRTGTGTMANGGGGAGVVWTVVNGSWSSNWSNGGKGPISAVKQAPRNAIAIASTYNWAISVRSIDATTNEIKWYMIEKNNKYWFGGTIIDTATSKKFNGVNFGFNNDFEGTKVNFTNVKVENGASITIPEAPWQAYYVEQWGKTSQGTAWPVKNDSTYLVGDATLGTGAAKPTGWATIRGGFGDPITITTDKAIIVSGQMEFVGGGGASAYTWLRYALTYQDSSTLKYPLTDTATWDSPKKHYGYEFCPRTGTGTMANGGGGAGVVWTVVNGSWSSNWSNGGKGPISAVKQAPRNAIAIAGTYNWAISVRAINATTNEIKWYMIEKNNKYWFGGTVIDTATTTKFNGINFGFNNDFEGTKVNLLSVKVDYGTPITVPEAPWQAYYVEQWGKTSQGTAWPVKNDSTYLVGDATLGTGAAKPTGWATIRGGFGDPITITTDKAVIVSGQMEFVGGGGASAYTWLRYALTYQDSSTLKYPLTDTATWDSPKKHYGYEFCPRTGTGTMANGGGGAGVVWTVVNGSWSSNWSNGGKGPISAVKQAPRNAIAIAGTYNWAISVRAIDATTNEIKWYMIEKNNKYWFGGTVIDTATTTKFNGINFGFNNDFEGTKVNLLSVKVDYGTPITVPEAPWQAYYVEQWGKTSQGTAWPVKNDSTYLVGDATLGTGAAKPTGWATIRGGFGDPITISTSKAIIVSGQMEFVGGGGASAYTWLRYALTYQDSSTLKYPLTDTATWDSPKKHYGYEFCPRTGTGTMANGGGGAGVVWTVVNGSWSSNWSNGGKGPISAVKQAPRNAIAIAGTYNWAISVRAIDATTNEIKWYMIEKNNKYWFGGTVIDTATTTKFNGVNFGFNNDFEGTKVNLLSVKVDMGNPITIPEAPWQSFYTADWGFIGGKTGGWKFVRGDVDGNAGIAGTSALTDWAVLRTGFGEAVTPKATKAIKVTGNVEFVGGGFTTSGSFRFGLLNSDVAGKVVDSVNSYTGRHTDSSRWDGTDLNNFGYLFVPQSGTNGAINWGTTQGTIGALVDGNWLALDGAKNYVLASTLQTPANTVATAGKYDFSLMVAPQGNGKNRVYYSFVKADKSYSFAGELQDSHSPVTTDKYNSVVFAFNKGNSITAVNIKDVMVDLVDKAVKVDENPTVAKVFALEQNYPNPFNPTTVIKYSVPKTAHVTVRIFDVLGRLVSTLVDEVQAPSKYTIEWNPSSLSSGVYLYHMEAKNTDGSKLFAADKKLMFMK